MRLVLACLFPFLTAFLGCSGSRVSARDAYEAREMACVTEGAARAGTEAEVRAWIDGCREAVRRTTLFADPYTAPGRPVDASADAGGR
jgi:hypothetical protein